MFRKMTSSFALVLAVVGGASAATFTVSKDGRGAYTTVQGAVNAAKAFDIVEILDMAVYEEQVTVDSSKTGLTIKSSNPSALRKPTIKYKDILNVSPKNCTEAKNKDLAGQFETNGALRLLRVRKVTINGIAVDGGGVYPFGANQVWDGDTPCRWPLQHGNATITLVVAGDITIRNCDLSNAYFGVNVKDRNEGGIFANPNPADIEPFNVVPLSGFGKTGNHLFEKNRIHNNSYGMFFESTWDLGSVIRYNLFFENHHPPAMIDQITKLTQDGTNHVGGAMLFKDMLYSPLAIYNNTFWHNGLIFHGVYKARSQHLVFNNIYGPPYEYWSKVQALQNGSYMEFSVKLANRMKHSVFASQSQAPTANYVPIMNGMQLQSVTGTIPPGTPIEKPFGISVNVKWFETPFESTDPASPSFLTPKWSDPNVTKLIVDQGWPDAGIKDADGTPADLGAIPSGGLPPDLVMVRPIDPLDIKDATVIAKFDMTTVSGSITNPKIKYFAIVDKLPAVPVTGDNWGPNMAPIAAAKPLTPTPLAAKPGSNVIQTTITPLAASDFYAFIEMTIEGTGSNGQPTASTVGFLPYRKLDYRFDVVVYSTTSLTTPVTTVKAGETYVLEITPRKVGQVGAFENLVNPVDVRLVSGANLYSATSTPMAQLTYPSGISGRNRQQVIFTKVPQGGVEYVTASGVWTSGTNKLPFQGTSDPIKVVPGDPEKVVFQDPPSKVITPGAKAIVDPGQVYTVKLSVYDRFDNPVNTAVPVNIKSNNATIGDIVNTTTQAVGPMSKACDDTGHVEFHAKVVNGKKGELFELEANISGKPADKADLEVGQARDKLWILYSDLNGYDATVQLNGEVGERKAVTIRASVDGKAVLATRQTVITLQPGTGLALYASPSATAVQSEFTLVNGEVVVWVTGTAIVVDGNISATPKDDNTILGSSRSGINFTKTSSKVTAAAYFADNGLGRVDRAEVYFDNELKLAPDSIVLYWPKESDATRRLAVRGSTITLDAANTKHLTVKLADPFPEGPTTFTGGTNRLGTSYSFDPAAPDVPTEVVSFALSDSVGPLIASAAVVERSTPGVDTLYLTFSERVKSTTVAGQSLSLIKADGSTLNLTVLGATARGDTLIATVQDETPKAPAAGDSLRINAAGPLTDEFGNKAHASNRPVPITVRRRPAAIDSAFYTDSQGDGVVDKATVYFSKKVYLSELSLSFAWTAGNKTDALTGTTLTYGADSMSVTADLSGAFTDKKAVVDKTSDDMQVSVAASNFPGDTRTKTVKDRAAPVIVSAVYSPGIALDDNTVAPDTLRAAFSEAVNGARQGEVFMLAGLRNGTATVYQLVLDSIGWNGNSCVYVVKEVKGVDYPATGDSVWINPQVSMADAQGNAQLNAGNKRVLLKVNPVPYRLLVAAGPNPFTPGVTPLGAATDVPNAPPSGVLIALDPLTKLREYVSLEAEVTIYDQTGNPVVMKQALSKGVNSNKLYFAWDGANRNGRVVGSGTYMAIISIRDLNNPSKGKIIKRVPIGVRR